MPSARQLNPDVGNRYFMRTVLRIRYALAVMVTFGLFTGCADVRTGRRAMANFNKLDSIYAALTAYTFAGTYPSRKSLDYYSLSMNRQTLTL